MAGKFELKTAANGQFLFNLVAGNGEIILTSETYTTKTAAEAGIAAVRTNAPADERFERKAASGGQPFFVLKAANGKVIGKSEMYANAAAMEKGITSVKKNAADATIQDTTV